MGRILIDALLYRGFEGLQGPLLQIDITQIVIDKADEPDSAIDFLLRRQLGAREICSDQSSSGRGIAGPQIEGREFVIR